MEESRIPKRVLYMNLETTRLRGRPKNRWQDEVRELGRIVGGEEWQEKVYNRGEWKKLLRWQGIVTFCTCQWNENTLKVNTSGNNKLGNVYILQEFCYINFQPTPL
jgi:hypothetical protein